MKTATSQTISDKPFEFSVAKGNPFSGNAVRLRIYDVANDTFTLDVAIKEGAAVVDSYALEHLTALELSHQIPQAILRFCKSQGLSPSDALDLNEMVVSDLKEHARLTDEPQLQHVVGLLQSRPTTS